MIAVRVSAGWTDDDQAYRTFLRYTEAGAGRWRDLELTRGDGDVLLLFNAPKRSDYDPARTIVFESEPLSTRVAEFRYPYPPEDYLAFYDLESHHFVGEWFVDPDEVTIAPVKRETISSITSGMSVLPRHRARKEFVQQWLVRLPELHDYGRAGPGYLPRYGELARKADGLLPYHYTVAAENTIEPNYFTEKVLDALLCEALPFYDGCPNLELFVDPGAFVQVDMTRPEQSLAVIQESIAVDLWSQRSELLRAERQRLTVAMNPLEVARRLIAREPVGWRPGITSPSLAGLPVRLAPVDPGDGGALLRAVEEASLATALTLLYDRDGIFLSSAPGIIAAMASDLPRGSVVVLGGVGMRFAEGDLGTRLASRAHRVRQLVPGPRVRASAVLLDPAAASSIVRASARVPLPITAALFPPVFYVPGPHMTPDRGSRAELAAREFGETWYPAAHRVVKRLPRGQRIARYVVDSAWLARDRPLR